MLDRDYFSYSGCANDSSFTCYFESLTDCSYEAHVQPLLEQSQSGMGGRSAFGGARVAETHRVHTHRRGHILIYVYPTI